MAARPVIKKIVNEVPAYVYFKPQGIPMTKLKLETIGMEEVESLKLKDIENLDQEAAAKKMGVSRSTFQRILKKARHKLAKAIIEGKALKVEGGNYIPGNKVIMKKCLMGEHHYFINKDDLSLNGKESLDISKIKCSKCGESLVKIESNQ